MLRALVLALLIANLLFFAWARGWLAPLLQPPHHGEREPERLASQVRPDAIKLLSPQAASAAVAAATAVTCIEAGPFNDVDLGNAEAALRAAGVPAGAWARQEVQPPPAWLVYMGRFADPTALRTKEDELRRLKLVFDELRAPPDLAPGLVLSRHDNRPAADAALVQLGQRGVRTARVVPLPPAPPQHWLRAPRADADLQARLEAIKPPLVAAAFTPCASRP